jgi:hypothetical protein
LVREADAYRSDLDELERAFFEAVGDGNSDRAMHLAGLMEDAAEEFRDEVLSRDGPACLIEPIAFARTVIDQNLEFYVRRAEGRDFPTLDEIPMAVQLLDLPHSCLEGIRNACQE